MPFSSRSLCPAASFAAEVDDLSGYALSEAADADELASSADKEALGSLEDAEGALGEPEDTQEELEEVAGEAVQDEPAADESIEQGEAASDEPIIVYKDEPIDLAPIAEDIPDIEIVSQEELTPAEAQASIELVEIAADSSLEAAISEIAQDPAVEFVQSNYAYSLMTTPNDAAYAQQYYIPTCGFDVAWDAACDEGKRRSRS